MASIPAIEERLSSLEAKLKELLKEKRPQDDPEVVRTRKTISDNLCDLMRLQQTDSDAPAERLWKLCFNKRIDEFRKKVPATPAGPARRKIAGEFKQYLGDCTRFFDDLAQTIVPSKKPHLLSRLHLCLGDIARYRELASDPQEARWTEAIERYRKAAEFWPQSGTPHNQLAVVASYQGRSLVSLYRYERALSCSKPFEVSRNNLKEILVKCSEELSTIPEDANKSNQEAFISHYLVLYAFLLLPESKTSIANAQTELAVIRDRLPGLLQTRMVRGEVAISLLMSAAFAIAHGEICGRLPSDKERVDMALRLFQVIAQACIEQSSLDARMYIESPTTPDREKDLRKTLLLVSLLCDFAASQGPLVLGPSVRSALEALEQTLAEIPAEDAPSGFLDEEEVEFAGFTLLGKSFADAVYSDVKHEATLGGRVSKIRGFVRYITETELKGFAADGRLLSTRPAMRAGTGHDDDDEEEILFRPAFAGPVKIAGSSSGRPAVQPLAAAYSAPPLPHYYPFSSGEFFGAANSVWGAPGLGQNTTWDANAFRWTPQQLNPPYGAAGPATASSAAATMPRPASRVISPPPGFHQ